MHKRDSTNEINEESFLPLSLLDMHNGVNHRRFPTWNHPSVGRPFQNLLSEYCFSHLIGDFQALNPDGCREMDFQIFNSYSSYNFKILSEVSNYIKRKLIDN